MKYFATTSSNIVNRLGNDRKAFIVDAKLSAFVLFDGLIAHDSSKVAVDRMTEAVMGTLYTHARVIRKNVEKPSYANRVRASLIMELAMLDAQREYAMLRREFRDAPDAAPRIAILIFMGNTVSVMHTGIRGIFLIRNGNMKRLSSTTAGMADSQDSNTDSSRFVGSGLLEIGGDLPRRPGSSTGNPLANPIATASNIELVHVDAKPGDLYLMASDGLERCLGDLSAIGQLSQRLDDIDKMMHILVEKAVGENQLVVTGLLIKTLGLEQTRPKELTDKMAVFRGICPFQDLNDEELLRVVKVMKFAQHEAGTHIIREGEKTDQLYIAVSGRFRVVRHGSTVAEFGPGTCFGEISLLCDIPHTADVVATKNAKVVMVSRHDFKRISDHDPQMGSRMLWQLSSLLSERLIGTTDALIARH